MAERSKRVLGRRVGVMERSTDDVKVHVNPGRRCLSCGKTEAECARTYPCCRTCGHAFGTQTRENRPPTPMTWYCTARCGFVYTRKGKPKRWCPDCGSALAAVPGT